MIKRETQKNSETNGRKPVRVAVLNSTHHVAKDIIHFLLKSTEISSDFQWNQGGVFPCTSVRVRLMTTDVAAKHYAVL